MATPRRLDIEALHRELKRALKRGARASRLVRFTPELVELLFPQDEHPDLAIHDRAIRAEDLIRAAIQELGEPETQVLSILYCLAPGTTGLTLEQRRQKAGEVLGLLPDTVRREGHEGLMVWDVCMEVYRRDQRDSGDKAPDQSHEHGQRLPSNSLPTHLPPAPPPLCDSLVYR